MTSSVVEPNIIIHYTSEIVNDSHYDIIELMKGIQKIVKSLKYSMQGLVHAYRTDASFRLEVNLGLPVYLVLAWLLSPFRAWEILVFVFSYLFILVIELVNTAFETMLDKLHPEQHEMIGRSKDIASAAVLLAFLFAVLVVAVLFSLRMTPEVPVNIVRPFV